MKRKAEDCSTDRENNKNIRLVFHDLYDHVWRNIFMFALGNLEDFATWCKIRVVSKRWNGMMDLIALCKENNDAAFFKHAFILAIRCDKSEWITYFLQTVKIDPETDERRAIREMIYRDGINAFRILRCHTNLKIDHAFKLWAAEFGAEKIILTMMKEDLKSFHLFFYHPVDNYVPYCELNMLTVLLKNGRYDVLMNLIHYWLKNRSSKLDRIFNDALSDPKILKFASRKGYNRLIQLIRDHVIEIRENAYEQCLKESIIHGNIEGLGFLLSDKKCMKDEWINDALILAVKQDFRDTVNMLLDYAAERDLDYAQVLNYALFLKKRSIIQTLIDHGIRVPSNIFYSFLSTGYYDLLLKNEPIIEPQFVLKAAIDGHIDVVEKLLNDPRLDRSQITIDDILLIVCQKAGGTRLVKQLLYEFDADPNAQNKCLKRAAKVHNNDIVRILIECPKINRQSVELAIQTVLRKTKYIDTLDILLSCSIHKTDLSLLELIKMAITNLKMVTELLRRHWENNVDVPLHWRIFYSMYYIKDYEKCFVTIDHREQITSESDVAYMPMHLKYCRFIRRDIDTCSCGILYIRCDDKTEQTLQDILRSIIKDLSKYSVKLGSFMDIELFSTLKKLWNELCLNRICIL